MSPGYVVELLYFFFNLSQSLGYPNLLQGDSKVHLAALGLTVRPLVCRYLTT